MVDKHEHDQSGGTQIEETLIAQFQDRSIVQGHTHHRGACSDAG